MRSHFDIFTTFRRALLTGFVLAWFGSDELVARVRKVVCIAASPHRVQARTTEEEAWAATCVSPKHATCSHTTQNIRTEDSVPRQL